MGDGSLTQDEIDALLQGADDFTGGSFGGLEDGDGDGEDGGLTPSEKEALTELMHNSLSKSSGSIKSFIEKDVNFNPAFTDVQPQQTLQGEYQKGYILFQSQLSGALSGISNVIIPLADAIKIASFLMSQDDAPTSELNGAQEQALKELMSPVITAYFVNLSNLSGKNFSTGPIKLIQTKSAADVNLGAGGDFAKIAFNFRIDGLVDTRLTQIISIGNAAELVKAVPGAAGGAMAQASGGAMAQASTRQQQIAVDNVEFPDISPANVTAQNANLNLLLDIKMDLTVELGRTRKYVKEILSLGEGSIIELDKLAGEPVDLLVNNKLIARGEVVVIDENFGVRVTDIVKPEDRLRTMSEGV